MNEPAVDPISAILPLADEEMEDPASSEQSPASWSGFFPTSIWILSQPL